MGKLLNSKLKTRSDEWYTQAPLVNLIKEYIELPDKIWCPCDGYESNFTKILKPAKYTTDNYFKHNFKGYAVVTNPAFSTIIDFYKLLCEQGVKFAIVAPQTFLTNSTVAKDIIEDKVKAVLPINTTFDRPDGSESKINVFILTNLPLRKAYDYPKTKYEGEPYQIEGSKYHCFNRTQTFRDSKFKRGWIPVTGIIKTKLNDFKIIDFMQDVRTLEGKKKFPRYLVEKKEK